MINVKNYSKLLLLQKYILFSVNKIKHKTSLLDI